jgi:hypothetical protein
MPGLGSAPLKKSERSTGAEKCPCDLLGVLETDGTVRCLADANGEFVCGEFWEVASVAANLSDEVVEDAEKATVVRAAVCKRLHAREFCGGSLRGDADLKKDPLEARQERGDEVVEPSGWKDDWQKGGLADADDEWSGPEVKNGQRPVPEKARGWTGIGELARKAEAP